MSCGDGMNRFDLEGVKQEIGVETIELNHDSCRNGEPDRRKNRSGGEKFFHDGGGTRGPRDRLGDRFRAMD
jgi:hypothetical protein